MLLETLETVQLHRLSDTPAAASVSFQARRSSNEPYDTRSERVKTETCAGEVNYDK